MVTIYKYKADPITKFIELPHYVYKVLKVDINQGDICCWALVDTELEPNYKGLVAIGTGWNITDEFNLYLQKEDYVGTVQETFSDAFNSQTGCPAIYVWHYFLVNNIIEE